MIISNTLQPMNLIFAHNIVTKSRTKAFIFLNTECQEVQYINAQERGEKALDLFQRVLEFQEVTVFENKTKKEIIAKLDELEVYAFNFEKEMIEK